jgi:predicted RNase H-like HicB family nuclease
VSRPGFDAYKIVFYRQDDGSWVAEVPAVSGCYALMATREEALAELSRVFDMIAEEYQERGVPLPEDTTEIVNV